MTKIIGLVLSLALLLSVSAVFAQDSTSTATTTTTIQPVVNIACVKTAVDTRETAIGSAVSTAATAVNSAYATRKTALLAAWDIQDNASRKSAIKTAWETWKQSLKDTRKTFNDARKAAWKQFATDRRTCKAPATGENPGNDQIL